MDVLDHQQTKQVFGGVNEKVGIRRPAGFVTSSTPLSKS
jgi:hypothetical protein